MSLNTHTSMSFSVITHTLSHVKLYVLSSIDMGDTYQHAAQHAYIYVMHASVIHVYVKAVCILINMQTSAEAHTHFPHHAQNHTRMFSLSIARSVTVRTRTIHGHCNTLQHTALLCNTLQHACSCFPSLAPSRYAQGHYTVHTATHCNTLQHTAPLCNTLQRTATHCVYTHEHYPIVVSLEHQHTPVHIHTRPHIFTHINMCIHTLIHRHIHAYTHIHPYSCIHTCMHT